MSESGQSGPEPTKWTAPSGETVARLNSLGLHPRAEGFGKIRVVGYYEVPLYPELNVLECIVRMPWWMVNLEEWHPYQPRGWAQDELGSGLADFYLSADGRELVGSYLGPPPIEQTTRFALVLYDCDIPEFPRAQRVRIPELSPIPERLLRLIWLDT